VIEKIYEKFLLEIEELGRNNDIAAFLIHSSYSMKIQNFDNYSD